MIMLFINHIKVQIFASRVMFQVTLFICKITFYAAFYYCLPKEFEYWMDEYISRS